MNKISEVRGSGRDKSAMDAAKKMPVASLTIRKAENGGFIMDVRHEDPPAKPNMPWQSCYSAERAYPDFAALMADAKKLMGGAEAGGTENTEDGE